jgi:hypothetical protein
MSTSQSSLELNIIEFLHQARNFSQSKMELPHKFQLKVLISEPQFTAALQ